MRFCCWLHWIYFSASRNFMNDQLSNFEVTDKQSFIAFLDLLRKDFLDNPNGWENKTLDTFLEALCAYANDIQGYYDNTSQKVNTDEPSWKTFADTLKRGNNV
jgi:hypothetical protein